MTEVDSTEVYAEVTKKIKDTSDDVPADDSKESADEEAKVKVDDSEGAKNGSEKSKVDGSEEDINENDDLEKPKVDSSKDSVEDKAASKVDESRHTRKHEDSEEDTKRVKLEGGKHTSVVAEHYNKMDEKGLSERTKSRIFYLRNFNNWIKSMLIGDYVQKIHHKNRPRGAEFTVLDLCCGKGGDLLKWRKSDIDYLVCADIAATSVEQCENRFKDMVERNKRDYKPQRLYKAEFIAADCTKEILKEKYKKESIAFDIVSCQFSFHYCFESLPQAERMLQNVSECLSPGGFFIGTTPDAYQIVHKLKNADGLTFGNDVYSITFDDKDKFPLFGAKYDFHLEDVVDCPEFLVYFPALERLAKKYQLKLSYYKRFDEYYAESMKRDDERRHHDNGRQLLGRMQALETYPPFGSTELSCSLPEMYAHARVETEKLQQNSRHDTERVGTLSQSEWEAICLYVVFAFEKVSDSS